ncbi:tripartite tricarboxylate transporter substrate binding protein [Geodermatophilus poikilotrophus]|uniref:Tripartite-type tricarboxylate transporter, receptor component TctC n=1 Tax=Geodermatophilus poikilotrophus TaxID=1333667 RepID=A0A1I0AUM5_9ACTN|nr:tripartite tricarboxylate transporter substrate binding protein [Geodermatophilus poikilotrophus]SES98067.1 Tripartite-type tricarboxylate transporter, receptor component TctC [Geodermatophilus poikilotrophus]
MPLTRPVRTLTALTALGLLAACAEQGGGATDDAAAYPSEEIRLLVPYAAGGPTDLTARAYGTSLEEQLGQTVVVENLPGGSGALATQELISAEPDGYTLSLVTAGTLVLTPLANEVVYTKDDVTPIGVMSEVPSVLAVGADSPHRSAEDFFTAAEQQPAVLTVGVPGASTPQGVELRRLSEEYGVEVTAVPFNGNAEMTTALLGGNVDAVLINASSDVTANIDGGQFRPLAVSSAERLSWLPDTPTLVESGFPELTLSGSTFGLAGPAGLPDEVVTVLEDALRTAHEDPAVVEQVGEEYIDEEFRGADELRQVLDRTQEVYEPLLG